MICDDMIVGAACMAHSAVEGGQVRLIVRPERREVYLFFILLYIFFLASLSPRHIIFFISFSGGNTSLSRDIVVTFLFSFYTLSIGIRTVVVERGVYVIVPISLTQDFLVSPPHVLTTNQ